MAEAEEERAAAAPAASLGLWNNLPDASTFLSPLLSLDAPSADALGQLSSVEPISPGAMNPQAAALFLRAAAKHIPVALLPASDSRPNDAGVKQLVPIVAELAGKSSTACQPRDVISKSGIIAALSHFHHADILSATNVEFLQCSLLAGQYRYAARILGNDWPRPEKGMPIEKVIRYFYLRGMVHIGCDDFQVAIRCFWTALSIPCEAASVIAVDAWKKMVLAKMLVLQDSVPYQSLVALPSTAPNSLSRILTSSHAPESTAGDVTSLGISTYMNLAKLFHGCDRQGFSRIRQDKAALFEADHNTGLVERVASDMEHRRVFHLASVYMNIPLTQLAAELGVSEQGALNTLGQIHGLNFRQENGMIFFGVSQDTSMPTKDVERLMHLAACIRKLDVSLAGSSKYQSLKIEAGKPPRGVDDF